MHKHRNTPPQRSEAPADPAPAPYSFVDATNPRGCDLTPGRFAVIHKGVILDTQPTIEEAEAKARYCREHCKCGAPVDVLKIDHVEELNRTKKLADAMRLKELPQPEPKLLALKNPARFKVNVGDWLVIRDNNIIAGVHSTEDAALRDASIGLALMAAGFIQSGPVTVCQAKQQPIPITPGSDALN